MVLDIDAQLITVQDNVREMFDYQQRLLKEADSDKSKLIDLAILQTLSPCGYYDSATAILKYAASFLTDIRIDIIGYYISLVWYCDTLAFFKDRVESQCSLSTPEYKSLMLYIQGYELWQNNDVAGAIAKLKESISAFSGHVHNYILLARLCGNNASMCLIEVARSNIHVRNIFNDIAGYVNPNNYIDEFISGRLMPMDTFNAIVSQMKH